MPFKATLLCGKFPVAAIYVFSIGDPCSDRFCSSFYVSTDSIGFEWL